MKNKIFLTLLSKRKKNKNVFNFNLNNKEWENEINSLK